MPRDLEQVRSSWPQQWPLWAQYALSLGAVSLALLARWPLSPWLGDRMPFGTVFTVLLPLVLLVRPGPFLAGALWGLLGVWFLVFPPHFSFRMEGPQAGIQLAIYLTAVLAAALAAWLSRHAYRRVESYLRDSREDFNRAQAVARTGSWRMDVQHDELHWSDECYRITGVAPGSPQTYESFLALVHPEDRAMVDRSWRAALTGAPYDIEHRFVVDGAIKWVRERAELEFDAKGQVRGGFGTCQDVTERKKAEQALRESAGRFRSVVNTVVDGIVTIGEDGAIQTFNPAAEKLFGYRREEAIGQNIKLLMPDPYRGEHDRYLENYRRTGVAKIMGSGREVLGRRKDGSTFPMELAVSEFQFNDQRCFTGIVRDITERKRAEQALAEADHRKDVFLAVLAHELRNPLAPIRSALQVLLACRPQPEQLQLLQMIDRQALHMSRLLDDLLEVSRIASGKIELRRQPLLLQPLIEAAVAASRPGIEQRGQQLHLALAAQPIAVHADRARLLEVFLNLLGNAIKYTPRGGHIWLEAEQQETEAVVRVRDNGIGIEAAQLPRLFQMFAQAAPPLDAAQEGLGIGLYSVRSLITLHGGSVEARSEGPGQGSEFILRLPVTLAVPREPRPTTVRAAAKTERHRILVADDVRDSADSLALLLQVMGQDVRAVYDAEGVLATVEAWRPEVLILDIAMPGMNGYELARRLRAQTWGRELVLVALTGWGQQEDRLRAQEAGFDHHFIKPIEAEALMSLLDSLRVSVL